MKRFLAIWLAFPSLLFGTAQTPDYLVYEGKSESIFSIPLESYFSSNKSRPTWLTEINTACWRGYVASWELIDDRLYLIKIIRNDYDSEKDAFRTRDITKRIMPGAKPPIPATWFSGTIRIPQGKEIEGVHMGFESVHERDLFLDFKNGELVNTRMVNNVPKRTKPRKGKNL